ncbi:hypothetical protein RHSIM_Rhsim02G0166700 [Rhododendron simsii]|uniref:Uncharacterized protein n=1 Tax=Rhododendron simsii TaxID=118357 RepID=A0A834HAZ4_RHOSS|nr:hypothetical protein RHSIM_Rhsim02G0166700 [Rhododendron simsii]
MEVCTDEFVGLFLVRHEFVGSENPSCRRIEIPAGGQSINECGPLGPRVGGEGRRRGGGKAERVSVVVILIGGGSLGVNAGFGLTEGGRGGAEEGNGEGVVRSIVNLDAPPIRVVEQGVEDGVYGVPVNRKTETPSLAPEEVNIEAQEAQELRWWYWRLGLDPAFGMVGGY